ncbi:MAG: DNRLRE domain-containing protein, partial [Planctomycetes bacterium]|nr:DNRLRE domain-containing protein [Planctomycetota bacterium]
MRYSAALARVALIGLAVLATPGPGRADQAVNILPNSGAELPVGDRSTGWYAASQPASGLRMWQDAEHARAGKACLAISNQQAYARPTSNNWAQRLRYIPAGKTISLAGHIRTQDAEAVNICVQCWGPGEERLVGFASTPVFRGTRDWTFTEAQDIVVPQGTAGLVVRAALTGKGQAFFDDLSLRVIGEPAPSEPEVEEHVEGRVLRVLPIVKDCMILSYLADWDHGDVDNLAVGNYDGGIRMLMAWPQPAAQDVSQPTGKDLSQPGLRFLLALYCRRPQVSAAPQPFHLQMHEILENWKETTSWEKQPRFAAEPVASLEIPPGGGWKMLEVTKLVQAQAEAQRPSFGIVLRFAEENRRHDRDDRLDYGFVSREGIGEWENRRPVLLVVDPTKPPGTRPVATRPTEKAPATPSLALIEYVEYLASIPGIRIETAAHSEAVFAETCEQANNASSEAIHRAMTATDRRQQRLAQESEQSAPIPHYERFLHRYPLTPEGLQMMGMLSSQYARAKYYAEARRLAAAAVRIARDTTMECMLEDYLAHVEEAAGDLDAAEARVRAMMAKPLPADPEDRRANDILFSAPN